MLLQAYIEYFEQLAARHKDIAHVPGSLYADAAPGSCRFATYNADDVLLKRTRTKVGYPALLAEVYEFDLSGTSVYDARATHRGAISIIGRATMNNAASEIATLQLTERILYEVVQRMYHDHGPGMEHCSTPFQYLDVQGADVMAFGPIRENEFGWRFEFSFRPRPSLGFNKPLAPVWLDKYDPPPPTPTPPPEEEPA